MRQILLGLCVCASTTASHLPFSAVSPTLRAPDAVPSTAKHRTAFAFRGTLRSTEADEFIPPATLVVAVTGDGVATHLGHFTATLHGVVNLGTGAGEGTFVFTAANGDQISGVFVGQATPTDNPNLASIEERATITGGTGRFAGANGEFTIDRTLNQTTGTSSGTFDGTINTGK
jgi:hypothetical protein